MMNKQSYLNEEHIIAYLDGELQLNAADVRKALQADPELARIVSEHYALSRTFARSSIESRFQLPADLDIRTSAFLSSTLNAARTHNNAGVIDTLAETASRIVLPIYKRLWFRRTSYGFAAAAVIAILWMSYSPREIVVEPTVAHHTDTAPMNIQNSKGAATEVTVSGTEAMVETPVIAPVKQQTLRTRPVDTPLATGAAGESNIAQTAANNPADAMISRRYAKMIKETPVVEITEHDKL